MSSADFNAEDFMDEVLGAKAAAEPQTARRTAADFILISESVCLLFVGQWSFCENGDENLFYFLLSDELDNPSHPMFSLRSDPSLRSSNSAVD
jgi:hypothetical protein